MKENLFPRAALAMAAVLVPVLMFAQEQRTLRYAPDGEDFVIVNGNQKFTRALYGGHSGFRVETSDVPEFGFYLPNMGGNLTFSVTRGSDTLQLNDADTIECRYRAGSRIYKIKDALLADGQLTITALAPYEMEGGLWKISTERLPKGLKLHWLYGGASGKRFSREGDLGVDAPDCFSLKPEACQGNEYLIKRNCFNVAFGKNNTQLLYGCFPPKAQLQVVGLLKSAKDEEKLAAPVLEGMVGLSSQGEYYVWIGTEQVAYASLSHHFLQAEQQRQELASQVRMETPDPYFNTIGSALSVAADAIWNEVAWLHGAIGWRMPLAGWRAAYTGDVLGWHDRARTHFNNYAQSQVTDVPPVYAHPQQDTALNLARAVKKWGTPMYSNGYICKSPNSKKQMNHYDMNLCYMDELLWHLNWTGDWTYAKQIWPVIERHLAWEKRNFDPDNDGLYDAYCCIWASDALSYSGGGVTHSSAYNYRANRMAAFIANRLGMTEKAAQYAQEAATIARALENRLWMEDKGVWAESQDLLGLQRLHTYPALWTVYHAIDSEVGNPVQQYKATQYVDREIPHIPVTAEGLSATADGLGYNQYETVSLSDWQPYAWSINNVAFAEVEHTALAYWQAGRYEAAFHLLKSMVLDGMYMGNSPGNFGQISFYDVARSECYRDFGDPIGMASRAYVQGLYGVLPDRLNNRLVIRPGFPKTWNHASLRTPDLSYSFRREGKTDSYACTLNPSFAVDTLVWRVRAYYDAVENISVNGRSVPWSLVAQSVEYPLVEVKCPAKGTLDFKITIRWNGQLLNVSPSNEGFVMAQQGQMSWIRPQAVQPKEKFSAGSISLGDFKEVKSDKLQCVSMKEWFNDSVTNLFQPRYWSPRAPYTTLQIPVNGIGEWCHPVTTFLVEDEAMRAAEVFHSSLGVDFLTPVEGPNILFTTRWDNFPNKAVLPLSGKATHAYLLMAGSTNAMQSRMTNAVIRIRYEDNTMDSLLLINPETWCPIEQDYYNDGLAFRLSHERPYRVMLKTGQIGKVLSVEAKSNRPPLTAAQMLDKNTTGLFGNILEGGAGQLLDLCLKGDVPLRSIELETLSNEVLVGIMAITLQR